jgi:hypothetical protein
VKHGVLINSTGKIKDKIHKIKANSLEGPVISRPADLKT